MQVTWEMLEDAVSDCRGCVLCQTRQHTVLGEGSRNADVMFVGEGPGQQEDEQGRPFVGPAGQLLDKMLAAIGLDRSVVYIANIVKCRPPHNRVRQRLSSDPICASRANEASGWIKRGRRSCRPTIPRRCCAMKPARKSARPGRT